MATYKKKKQKKTARSGIVFINATFNNTIITITDERGEALCWESAGTVGYKGSRKATPLPLSSPWNARAKGREGWPQRRRSAC